MLQTLNDVEGDSLHATGLLAAKVVANAELSPFWHSRHDHRLHQECEDIMSDEEPTTGTSRRTVLKAAAWAAPVVAVAAAAPLAVASPSSATVYSGSSSGVSGNFANGDVAGNATGWVGVNNVVGTWQTGELTSEIRLSGPFTSTATATFTNGSLTGTALAAGTYVNTIDGVPWAVVVTTRPDGGWLVTGTAPSQTVASQFFVPSFEFSGNTDLAEISDGSTVEIRVRVKMEAVTGSNWAGSTTAEWPSED